MIETTIAPAPHLPFLDPLKARAPGLWPLDPSDWVQIDAAYAPQMAMRDSLIGAQGGAQADAVAIALPEAAAPLAELWETLAAHAADLDGFHRARGALRRPDGVTVIETGGIAALGRLAQEDWLLLADRAPGGAYRLLAGNLCFPSRWRLADKIGRPLTAIHDPVPGNAERLAPRVDRIFAGLRPEAPLQRLNWMVHGAPDLHQPRAAPPTGAWYLRTERQTLRRLPQTGAVVFGVKTAVSPVDALTSETRAALRDALAALDPETAAYKDARPAIAALSA